VDNASGGTLDFTTGAYKTGARADAVDLIEVKDSLGGTARATIHVGSAINITPEAADLPPRGTVSLAAAGGAGTDFEWGFVVNFSGGTLDPVSGLYTAGAKGNGTDVVEVSDGLGNRARLNIRVGAELSVSPATVDLPAGGQQRFVVSGGSGRGYRWALSQNRSGGNIDAESGDYRAGALALSVDIITVHDELGNTATATVNVKDGQKPKLLSAVRPVVQCGQPVTFEDGDVPQVSGSGPFAFQAVRVSGPVPGGLHVDEYSGRIYWTPGPEDRGEHEFGLRVSSATGEDTQTIRVSVECEESAPTCGCVSGSAPRPSPLAAWPVVLLLGALGATRRRRAHQGWHPMRRGR
jgi:MYXO-CTERM domain-containing protein